MMFKKLAILALFLTFVAFDLSARSLVTEKPIKMRDIPEAQQRVHRVGNVYFCNTNWGFLGSQLRDLCESMGGCFNPYPDSEVFAPSFEVPPNSGIDYLFQGALWIGAIVTKETEIETLVTVGADGWYWIYEIAPGEGPEHAIKEKSRRLGVECYNSDAVSEQDIIAVFSDTADAPLSQWDITTDWDGRAHHPLGVEIAQIGYSWSLTEYDDFIVLYYVIKNIGTYDLSEIYLGFHMDTDIKHYSENPYSPEEGAQDDLTGFLKDYIDPSGETTEVNIAWAADNDGQPRSGTFTEISPNGVIGIKLLGCSNPDPRISYNWWGLADWIDIIDWGPWLKVNQDMWEDINPYSSGIYFPSGYTGIPGGDRSKYFLLSNGEVDFDQIFTDTIPKVDTTWVPAPPNQWPKEIVQGIDLRFLYSFGPFDLAPGDTIFAVLALIAGENFHTEPYNRRDYLPYDPYTYYSNLNFSDLVEKYLTIQEIYDSGMDLGPPAPIRNMKITEIENGSVYLSWIATGDDINLGKASYYDLRYSNLPVDSDTAAWWEIADMAMSEPVPSEPGSVDSCQVSGLSADSAYCFIIRVCDDVGYCSHFSNIAYSGLPGDVDLDGQVDIDDIVIVIQYLFKSGTQPSLLASADVNGDCLVNIVDVVYLVNYVLKGGAAPQIGCA